MRCLEDGDDVVTLGCDCYVATLATSGTEWRFPQLIGACSLPFVVIAPIRSAGEVVPGTPITGAATADTATSTDLLSHATSLADEKNPDSFLELV